METEHGWVSMPAIDEGGLGSYLGYIENHFVTRPFGDTGRKDYSGLLVDPMFSVPDDPVYDLALTWRPKSGQPPEVPLTESAQALNVNAKFEESKLFRNTGLFLTLLIVFLALTWSTTPMIILRIRIMEMIHGPIIPVDPTAGEQP